MIMFHGHLDYFQKPSLGGRLNTKLGDHGTLNAHNCCCVIFYHVWGPAWIEIYWNSIWVRARSHMTSHSIWGSWPHYVKLEVSWDGLWTLSSGLSQFHGHGSWLVCEVALGFNRVRLGITFQNTLWPTSNSLKSLFGSTYNLDLSCAPRIHCLAHSNTLCILQLIWSSLAVLELGVSRDAWVWSWGVDSSLEI